MPTYTAEKVQDWDDEHKERVCQWCWDKDYGTCDDCALFRGVKPRVTPEGRE